jgi:hypothetical protein
MKNLFVLVLCAISAFGIAQAPANDACGGAITSAQNGSCQGGTTAGATDNWVGTVGCQTGNNAEVWYSFVATGTQAQFTVTAGTMGGNIEITMALSTLPPCNGLSIAGQDCGASPNTATFATTPGSTYYYTISSTGAQGTFTTCVLSSSPPPAAGLNCSNAATLCTNSGFSQGTSNSGVGTQEVSTSNSCWGSGGERQSERQSKWFKFSIGCSGTLAFNINPVVSGDDYDFAVWNVTSDPGGCTTKGSSIGCNWSGCKGSTGLSSCPLSEPGVVTGGAGCFGGPAAWSSPINVVAGNVYALLVDNFSTSNSGFSLTFGGACGMTAVIGPNAAFTGVITNSCMTLTTTKTCPISPTTNSTYLWNFGDGYTATTMNASHTYTAIGNYNVSLTVTDLLGCSITTSQAFNIGCVPLPVEFLYFTGTKRSNSSNLLEWATASEKNNAEFIIERSENAVDFSEIQRIKGAGNSNRTITYSAIDHDPVNGTAYYRLKQVDITDGKSSYSNVISINNSRENKVTVAPNPANDMITINYNCGSSSEEVLNIYDNKGNIVLTQKLICSEGINKTNVDISRLNTGMYMVFVSLGDKLYKTRLIKN